MTRYCRSGNNCGRGSKKIIPFYRGVSGFRNGFRNGGRNNRTRADYSEEDYSQKLDSK